MADLDTVTFALPTGAKVTAPRDVARKLGWVEPQPEPKRTRKAK